MKFLIIQADNRQIFMADFLREKGFESVFFSPNLLSGDNERKFDAAIFALPTVKNSRINCEYEISTDMVLPLIKKNGYVFSAMADSSFIKAVDEAELNHYDFYKREELITLNAYATAQAVLELVLINSNVLLQELNILVTGYGKTGEAIAEILKANNVCVTVAARKIKDRVRVESKNMNAICFDEIKDYAEKYDIVINTVPETIIRRNLLKKFRDDCVFLEIASKPYGIEIDECEKQNKKLIIASSLPGKYVACSAGKFIARTIINIIREEGING